MADQNTGYRRLGEEDEGTSENENNDIVIRLAGHVQHMVKSYELAAASVFASLTGSEIHREEHQLESVPDLFTGSTFKKANHFYAKGNFLCPIDGKVGNAIGNAQHHFMTTKTQICSEEKEYRISYLHYRRINTYIRREIGMSRLEGWIKKRIVWEDEMRIKEVDGEYRELVRDGNGKWTVATSPEQETPLFKMLREGKWYLVTDNGYPNTPSERKEIVRAGLSRLKDTKFDFVNNNCETFITSVMLQGEGRARQLESSLQRIRAHAARIYC